jgi:hypothetical protein
MSNVNKNLQMEAVNDLKQASALLREAAEQEKVKQASALDPVKAQVLTAIYGQVKLASYLADVEREVLG